MENLNLKNTITKVENLNGWDENQNGQDTWKVTELKDKAI